MLICHHRLGLQTPIAEKLDFALDALPHNLGILELIATIWKGGKMEKRLEVCTVANIEMRKRLRCSDDFSPMP
jgi:hypothetical protein